MKREKQVICEEIRESVENPSDLVHDIFAETFWGDHPLGRPILGTIEAVSGMSRAQVMNYLSRHYRSEGIVVAAAGAVSHRKLVRLAKQKLDVAPGATGPFVDAFHNHGPRIRRVTLENSQTHVCLGFPGLRYSSKLKTAALLLSTYLGGGMSSVLFQKVRENRGLAYSVYSYLDYYRDAGVFGVYMASDKRRVAEAFNIAMKVLGSVKKRAMPSTLLDQVKRQLKGQIGLAMESTMSHMNRLARNELMLGEFVTINRTMRAIDRVTPAQILELANRVIDESSMACACVGVADGDVFDSLARI